jgi:hypothetical protein
VTVAEAGWYDLSFTYFKRGNRIYFNRRDLEEWMTQERIPSEGDIEAKAARR